MDKDRIGIHKDNVLCKTSKMLSSNNDQIQATSTKKMCFYFFRERATLSFGINIMLLQETLPARKELRNINCTHYVTLDSPHSSTTVCYPSLSHQFPCFSASKVSGNGSLKQPMTRNLMQQVMTPRK